MQPNEAIAEFKTLLQNKGLKCTPERKRLVEFAAKQEAHFTADGLYRSLSEQGVRISRDTVFRTLPLLLECGVLQKSVGEGRHEYFEPLVGQAHHDHMVCLRCEEVIEFHSDQLERIQQSVCDSHNFTLAFHDHRLFGYCSKCLESNKAPH